MAGVGFGITYGVINKLEEVEMKSENITIKGDGYFKVVKKDGKTELEDVSSKYTKKSTVEENYLKKSEVSKNYLYLKDKETMPDGVTSENIKDHYVDIWDLDTNKLYDFSLDENKKVVKEDVTDKYLLKSDSVLKSEVIQHYVKRSEISKKYNLKSDSVLTTEIPNLYHSKEESITNEELEQKYYKKSESITNTELEKNYLTNDKIKEDYHLKSDSIVNEEVEQKYYKKSDSITNDKIKEDYHLKSTSVLNSEIPKLYITDTELQQNYNLIKDSIPKSILEENYNPKEGHLSKEEINKNYHLKSNSIIKDKISQDYHLKSDSTLNTILASNYLKKTEVESNYKSKEEVNNNYNLKSDSISNTEVSRLYNKKSESISLEEKQKDYVFNTGYTSNEEVAKNYILKTTLNTDYLLKSVVNRDYYLKSESITNEERDNNYVIVSESTLTSEVNKLYNKKSDAFTYDSLIPNNIYRKTEDNKLEDVSNELYNYGDLKGDSLYEKITITENNKEKTRIVNVTDKYIPLTQEAMGMNDGENAKFYHQGKSIVADRMPIYRVVENDGVESLEIETKYMNLEYMSDGDILQSKPDDSRYYWNYLYYTNKKGEILNKKNDAKGNVAVTFKLLEINLLTSYKNNKLYIKRSPDHLLRTSRKENLVDEYQQKKDIKQEETNFFSSKPTRRRHYVLTETDFIYQRNPDKIKLNKNYLSETQINFALKTNESIIFYRNYYKSLNQEVWSEKIEISWSNSNPTFEILERKKLENLIREDGKILLENFNNTLEYHTTIVSPVACNTNQWKLLPSLKREIWARCIPPLISYNDKRWKKQPLNDEEQNKTEQEKIEDFNKIFHRRVILEKV